MPELKSLYKDTRAFTSCIIALLVSLHSPAQNTYVPLNGFTSHLIDRMDIQQRGDARMLHTEVKPFLRKEVVNYTLFCKTDSAGKTGAYDTRYLLEDNAEYTWQDPDQAQGKFLGVLYAEPATLYKVETPYFSLRINPVLDDDGGISSAKDGLLFLNTRGIELRGGIDHLLGFYLYATDNQGKFPAYVDARIAEAPQVIPGAGLAKIFKGSGYDFPVTHGYIAFDATPHIQVQFGQDKLFIGDGIRSMIWSDNAKDFVFLKLNAHVWKLDYEDVFAQLLNFHTYNIYNSLIPKKYAAFHRLGVNISGNVNLGVFESVIFSRSDSTGNSSGFDLSYLNPVIFYRAVESGLGSPDNVLLGADGKWNFLHHFSLYGQFVLDEFVFDHLRSGDGWWGNKFATQIGLKYIDAFGISHLDLQAELNSARPYTYSYENDNGSSYTHYAQAIAHPLGANFREYIFSVWYQPLPQWVLSASCYLATYGADTSRSNWGGNIFLDYNTHEMEYGNTTGQGVATNLTLGDLLVTWQFYHNMFLDAGCILRRTHSALEPEDIVENYFSLGIRINDVLRRNDF